MEIRKRCMAGLFAGLFALASCSSDKSDSPAEPEGGGVGAKCSADSQCTGYTGPACVTDLKPVADLVTDPDPKFQPFKDFHLPFPGGYCSTTLDQPCTADADCGDGGGCFLAFEGVPPATIDSLNMTGLPFDIKKFAVMGICMKPCTADSECRTGDGYSCLRPINGLVKLFNDKYAKKFCTVSVDDQIAALLSSPDAG
jgi:hypothetical protein